MAMACLRFFTSGPVLEPEWRVPEANSCMVFCILYCSSVSARCFVRPCGLILAIFGSLALKQHLGWRIFLDSGSLRHGNRYHCVSCVIRIEHSGNDRHEVLGFLEL